MEDTNIEESIRYIEEGSVRVPFEKKDKVTFLCVDLGCIKTRIIRKIKKA